MPSPVKIFYSYSHKDEEFKEELVKHLKTLKTQGYISDWHDRMIPIGNDYDKEINANLLKADIVLFLISIDFIASEYCTGVEVKLALERHQKNQAKCIPIYLRECNFKSAPFAHLQGIPRDIKFVTSKEYWDDYDKPFTLIANELENEVKKIWENQIKVQTGVVDLQENSQSDSEEDLLSAIKLLKDKEKQFGYNSSSKEIKEIRELREKILSNLYSVQEKIDNIPSLLEKYPIELFNSIFTSETLNKQQRDEIENIRSSDKYKWYHRSLIVSALTLSLLYFQKVDQYKILFLIDFIKDEEDKVWQKAITGLTISLTYKKNAWLKYGIVTQRLQSFKQNDLIQEALAYISFILDSSLYSLYFPNKNIFDIPYFRENVAHCFIPFFKNNPGEDFFLENSSENDADAVLEIIRSLPFPDIIKYAICYSESTREKDGQKVSSERRNFIRYLLYTSRKFEPYLQYLSELFGFVNFYPNVQVQVFNSKLSVADAKLRDYILNEVQRHRITSVHLMHIDDFANAVTHLKSVIRYKENDEVALVNLASCYEKLRKYDDEIQIRRKIEAISPDDLNNLIRIANILELSDQQESLVYYSKCISLDNKSTSALIERGRLYRRLKDFSNSINDFNSAIAIDPKLVDAYVERADSFLERSEKNRAFDDFDEAIKIEPKNTLLLYCRGIAHANNMNYSESMDDLNAAILLDPEDSKLYCARGYAYRRQNKYDAAFEDFNKAIKLDRKNAEAYIDRSNAYLDKKQFDEAFSDLTKAIELDPYNHLAYTFRGIGYKFQKKYEKAIEAFNKALQLYPQDIISLCRKGQLYGNIYDFDNAFQTINTAIDLNPKDAQGYLFRAYIHGHLGDYKNALSDLDLAISLVPNLVAAFQFKADMYRGIKDYASALLDINKAIELMPEDSSLYVTKAELFRDMNAYDDALLEIDKALNLQQESGIFRSKGIILRKMKKNNEALDAFNSGIQLDHNDGLTYHSRGLTYLRIDNLTEAYKDFKTAVSLDAYSNYSIYGMATVHRLKKEFDMAFNCLKQARHSPNSDFKYREKGGYYSCMAEIYYSLNERNKFLEYLDLAFQNKIEIDDIEDDVLKGAKDDGEFLDLLKKYNMGVGTFK